MRVIFSSTSAGAGHNQAALALMAGLKARREASKHDRSRSESPEAPVEFVDALQLVPAWFRAYYAGSYTFGVTRAPRLYGWCYDRLNRPTGPRRRLSERIRLAFERAALGRYRRWLLERRPALVVATHYLTAPMIGRLVGRGVQGLRLMVVVTDNEVHRFWYAENVERYFVPNDLVKAQVMAWGISPERITVSGIPVHPRWTAALDRERIYRDWNLPPGKPIVILSGGTYFVAGPIGRIARAVLDGSEATVVVLCGANKELLAALAGFPEAGSRLRGVPFTDKGHELSEVAALMVTKAGGLMTSECLAKGVAMVLTKPIPGQEAANAVMLAREGAAVLAPTTEEIISQVRRLLESPDALAALRANAKRLHKPATDTIVGQIIKALG